MNKSFLLFLLLTISFRGFAGHVISFDPAPNYDLTTDSDDKKQLLDGEIGKSPIWLSKDAVGWSYKTPVTISIKTNIKNKSAVVKLHVDCSIKANVSYPRRIDIYTNGKKEQKFNVGFWEKNEKCGNKDKWISIPVVNLFNEIDIVIHSDGAFVFVDEIVVKPIEESDSDVSGMPVLSPKEDSLVRLKRQLSSNRSLDKDADKWSGFDVWVADDHYGFTLKDKDNKTSNKKLSGLNNESESLLIGMKSSIHGLYDINILPAESSHAFELYEAKKVLTSFGDSVLDPLVPIEGSVRVRENEASYIWVKADFSKLPLGLGSVNIEVSSRNNENLKKSVLVDYENYQSDNSQKIRNVVWGYPEDIPVWNALDAVLNDLKSADVNVQVIHPMNIPVPGQFSDEKNNALYQQLLLFNEVEFIYLFMGWGGDKNPFEGVSDKAQYDLIKKWLDNIKRIYAKAGRTDEEVIVYPIDEPRDAELDLLYLIAKKIKYIDSNIKVYTNPIESKNKLTQKNRLNKLIPVVDYWQPKMRFAKNNKDFFAGLERDWGVFHVPPSPAKRANVVNDYRLLGLNAWVLGASGLGVWSYSDTAKSSAWDDFDGIRPDWSMVYEENGSVVSSIRWEAYKDAVEDLKLLRASGLAATQFPFENAGSTSDLRRIRAEALKAIGKNNVVNY